MLLMVGMSYVFFFQAEDGIRDLIVTGVQTCALPISAPLVEMAGTPMPCRHIATSGAVIVSPLATSMSSSRAGGSGLMLWASEIRRSVVWPIAETTATTW